MPNRRDFETEDFEGDLTAHEQARKNLQRQRHWQNRLITMAVVIVVLVVVWAVTGAGYFWPGWVIAAFAVVMILGFARSQRGPISQKEVEDETHRIQSRR
ncbi:MAG TPA: 2TM domain-containing protein [Acidimicrobiales bacterium]|nr:2TM domain-containing protein [Acidimicrobiales bacterium]